jgi:hypothetical protein
MVNSRELIGTTEYLTLYTRCRINRCRYNRVRLYFTCVRRCTCLQHLQLPEGGCGLQPKRVGVLKPIAQFAGNKLACNIKERILGQ